MSREDAEWLVDAAIRSETITASRGAELLGVTLVEMLAIGFRYHKLWDDARPTPTPPDAPCGLCGESRDDPDHGIGGSHAPTRPDALREAYAAALEATDPFIWDYPMTEDERRYAWKHLRETRGALRAALEAER